MKEIGIELYCRKCGHEERHPNIQTLPTFGHNVACPLCGYEYMYCSPFIVCHCGTTVYFHGTTECEGCGQLYNGFGQELKPRNEWMEDY